MFGTYFYHERIRKSVATFGSLFNNIYVLRKNAAGAVISQAKVPLSYAPQQKFSERIRENPNLPGSTQVALKLPRMSFEITSVTYDQGRQLQRNNDFITQGSTNLVRNKFNSYTPYTIGFSLNAYAKTQDDALQIVEQILPFFSPQYTLTIKPLADFQELKEDVPVTITGVTFSDDFEGSLEQRRTIIYTLDFEMKVNFYGPIAEKNVIRSAITNVFDQQSGLLDSDQRIQTITITPDPSSVIGLGDSDFGFTTNIAFIGDSS